MGSFEFKNVRRPMDVYALANEGVKIPQKSELKGKVADKVRSIAVMPFLNMSADQENEYFSDGITEELINALTKVDGLQVTSRTSTFAYKGKNIDAREIGKELNVSTLLEGSVRKAANKVRISAKLISAIDGFQMWANSYDRHLEDIFEVQDEISKKIANQLRKRLTSKEKKVTIVTSATGNFEAYNLYLQGLFYYNKWTQSNALKALDFYQRAIGEEPNFSQAYSGVANCYIFLGNSGYWIPEKTFKKAEEATSEALKLQPENEEALYASALVQYFFKWNWDKGLKRIKKVLKVNPNSGNGHLLFSLHHLIKGDLLAGRLEMEKAYRIDPMSPMMVRTLGDNYYFAGEYDKAIEYYDKVIQIDPQFIAGTEFKGWCYLMKGEFDRAIEIFKSLGSQTTFAMRSNAQLSYAYALKGDMQEAQKFLDLLIVEAGESPKSSFNYDLAVIYTGMGIFDKAFEYLEKCMEERNGGLILLNVSPIWEPLAGDDRYISLIQRIGLEERK